jgi:hypothetical protein
MWSSSKSEFLPPLQCYSQENPVAPGKLKLEPVIDTGKTKISDRVAIRGKFALAVVTFGEHQTLDYSARAGRRGKAYYALYSSAQNTTYVM